MPQREDTQLWQVCYLCAIHLLQEVIAEIQALQGLWKADWESCEAAVGQLQGDPGSVLLILTGHAGEINILPSVLLSQLENSGDIPGCCSAPGAVCCGPQQQREDEQG